MNRNAWKWLLAISLSLNAGMIAAVAWNATRTDGPVANEAAPRDLPRYLGLTPDQRRQWERIEAPFLDELAGNWRQIRARRETLVRHIFAPVPDKAAIDREQEAIAGLQNAQQRRVIAQLLAERELLDERQRTALRDLLLDRYAAELTEEERLHRKHAERGTE